MEEEFELPVKYKGEEQMLNAKLIVTGYTHKFSVDVNGQIIIFEPDEERNCRAVIPYDDINHEMNIDKNLLKAIAASIEGIVRDINLSL
jgi:hypothetical protein